MITTLGQKLDNVRNSIGWLTGTVIPLVEQAGGDTSSLKEELSELEAEEYGLLCSCALASPEEDIGTPLCPCGTEMKHHRELMEDYLGWKCPSCDTLLDDVDVEMCGFNPPTYNGYAW
jgi:hypothetical protein